MQRRIALKRLTASDLTIFEWQFRNRNAGNQKSINLTAAVFISEMFPSLPEVAETQNWRIPIDLSIYGPGHAGLYNLQRKIIKGSSYKNWRLDGEYISDPQDDPTRFHVLEPEDFVIFDFIGAVAPNSAKMVLIARGVQADQLVHQRLSVLIGDGSMAVLSVEQLQAIADEINDDDHPIHELTLGSELEDAAVGGAKGCAVLSRRPRTRKVGRDELQRARQAAEQIGRTGEEFVSAYLAGLKANGAIRDVEWVSDTDAVAPYDFLVTQFNGQEVTLDVKSTAGEFERPLHISSNELSEMSGRTRRYDIYRVFGIAENTARLRIAENVGGFAAAVRQHLTGLPGGVQVDSVSVEPVTLPFGDPISLTIPDEEEVGFEG
jgi:hypothetical protein